MPYTQEELQKLDFYQNLINEDEQRYLQNRETLLILAAESGSSDDGKLVLRSEDGNVLVFENPYTGELYPEDPSVKVIVSLISDNLRNDVTINEILDREIREL